jgi:hypothetical protein
MPSPRYTVRLPPALDALVQARVRAGTPFAVLIREALSAYLADIPPTGAPTGAPTRAPTPADSADTLHILAEQVAVLQARVEALEQALTPRRQAADSPADTPLTDADRRADRAADSAPTAADTTPTGADTVPALPSRRGRGRRKSPLREQIEALLAEHPEGLTAEQLRGYLTPGRAIGDLLAGMRRSPTIRTARQGNAIRYFLVQDEGRPRP